MKAVDAHGNQVARERTRIVRVGGWVLAADPNDSGLSDGWPDRPSDGAVPAPVPGVVQQVLPEHVGIAWYWTDIGAIRPAREGFRWRIEFGAVDYRASVWVNGQHAIDHDNGETPFAADITGYLTGAGPNLIAVRVVQPTDSPIDGYTRQATPHRNKRATEYVPGWLHDNSGILLPVSLIEVPETRIDDVFVRADWATGGVVVDVVVEHEAGSEVQALAHVRVEDERLHRNVTVSAQPVALRARVTRITFDLAIADHHLWDLDDPYLYRLEASVVVGSSKGGASDARSVRFGFRDFRVQDGFFRLNGRRIFLRSSHTGNHVPVGQVVATDPDLIRRDIIMAKATGFNTIRFMSGIAWPEQLDLCDELGLLVWQEPMAAWLLRDSDRMQEIYDRSLREMVVRDRNHPSLVIWGMLTETPDGPVFRHAHGQLGTLRELDPTRLVILNSGRFDASPSIGSVSNPGGSSWEHVWGNEAPGAPGKSLVVDPATGWLKDAWDNSLAGYIEGNGDSHIYPYAPHTSEAIAFLRGLGAKTQPHLLSEYGVGSLMNVIGELRRYEQAGAGRDLLDHRLVRSMAESFEADWARLGMDGIYPFPEDMLLEAQRLHSRQRSLGFDIVRSNARFAGFNVTGLLDHALTGEGFWTFWREWKPGIVDVLSDGWAPIRWCLFASTTHGYVNRDVELEAVLATEDVLTPATYPARIRLSGPDGTVWQRDVGVTVPQPSDGGELPLAVSVFREMVGLPPKPGRYVLAASLDSGAHAVGGRLPILVAGSQVAPRGVSEIHAIGLPRAVSDWLGSVGVSVHDSTLGTAGDRPAALLVGDMDPPQTMDAWSELLSWMAAGTRVVFLAPSVFALGDESMAWLPIAAKAKLTQFYDWVYHKECVSTDHPMFDSLPGPGLMDWDVYGPVISHHMVEDLPTPHEVAAAAFAIGYPVPGGYANGVMAGAYRVGRGAFLFNTFELLSNVDRHPLADAILLNLLAWATRVTDAADGAEHSASINPSGIMRRWRGGS